MIAQFANANATDRTRQLLPVQTEVFRADNLTCDIRRKVLNIVYDFLFLLVSASLLVIIQVGNVETVISAKDVALVDGRNIHQE